MSKLESITNNEVRRDSRLKSFLRKAVLTVGLTLGTIFASAQSYDANFKVRELTHGTGADVGSANVSLVDATNNIQYLGQTDANGVATINGMKPGTYQTTVKKEGFIQFVKANYTVDGNKQVNVSLIKKLRVGDWGNDTFDVAFYGSVFPNIFADGGIDPPHRLRFTQINNKILNADAIDSTILSNIEQNIQQFTGYDLINYVTSGDSLHTIYANSNTNTSANSTDANGIIVSGFSKMTNSDILRQYFHEIVRQFSMRPPTNGIMLRPSVMDPAAQTMTDPQIWDYDNLAVTTDEHLAVKRGEQNVFNMSHMQEFSPFTSTTGTSILMPISGATNLPTSIEVKAAIDLQAKKYRLQVSKNETFTDFVFNGDVFRNDTILTNLPAGTQLYIRENVSNDLGTSAWSPTVTVSTAGAIVYPDQALIGAPLNNATKVGTPVPYTVSANNATSFRIVAARNSDLSQILKDTIVLVNNPNIPLPKSIDVYTQVFGINANGTGLGSVIVHYTTIKADPTNANVLTPINNAIKVARPVNFTNEESINAEQYRWRIKNHISKIIVLDSLLNDKNGFPYDKLTPGETYEVTVQPINSDVQGNESAPNIFTIIKDKPGVESTVTPANNATKVVQPFTYTNTSGTNSEQHRWQIRELDNTIKLDTLVNALQFIYDKLEPGKTYKVRVKGVNSDQEGDWSADNIYTIIKGDLNSILITGPLNNATEVTSPVSVTSTTGGQYAEGYKYEMKTLDDLAVLDTATLGNSFNKKLPGNRTFKVRGWAYNSDKEGTKSAWTVFTTFDNPATIIVRKPNSSSTIDPRLETTFEYEGADIDNDPMKFDLRLWNTGSTPSDTTIYDIVGQKYVLPPNKLQSKTTYFYTVKAKSGSKSTTSSTETFNTITVGINDTEVLKGNMVIYPNPNPNYIKFHQDIQGETDIDIINMLGSPVRHVYHERQPPGDYLISVDKNGLATGIYLIRKTTQGTQKKQVETGKIIINE